ncbi:hypothetical protein Ccar_05150 [Clostridium carboxidivorans P7]|uniref:Uncharacterized protein n=1 Tax=Clostridium carboxidivorans P7 TaxID=536227 RepID=C6PVL0_9CLOT|nr:hypothetical protein [Clostridium carboxidivorans]AKN30243.1 hypothetical protein Ccar_05150 [Clostridium carboxidivorans P7]EET86707.1 conserved hypothetical protein [Clostridium carboxidivorans P7]
MYSNEVFSTGVLAKNTTKYAVANIANIGTRETYEITVEVWDWSSYSNPVKLPVLIGENEKVIFPYKLKPNHLTVMYTNITSASIKFYEIRVIYPRSKDIVIKCY